MKTGLDLCSVRVCDILLLTSPQVSYLYLKIEEPRQLIPECVCVCPLLRFYFCVFTQLHLDLIVKCDLDFMHSHKHKIPAMLQP